MSKELKPCPFCGCHDRRVSVRKMGSEGYRAGIDTVLPERQHQSKQFDLISKHGR